MGDQLNLKLSTGELSQNLSGDVESLNKNRPYNSKLKTIFISTGEVSGDLQGSLLIEALKRQAVAAGWELKIVALGAIAWQVQVPPY